MVRDIVRMRDIRFEKGLFENWRTGKIMDELTYVSRILDAHGVDEQTAEVISPYRSDLQAYADSVHDISHGRANEIMSSRNVWDVYNDLTRFATHNDVWEKDDNRRGSLKAAAVNFLGRERDIRKYVDIF